MVLNENTSKDQKLIISIYLPSKINLVITKTQISALWTTRDATSDSSVCRAPSQMAERYCGGARMANDE